MSGLLIDTDELERLLHDRDVRVVDCRFTLTDPPAGRRQYLESHVPGAVYAHLDTDLAGPVTAHSGRHPLPEPEDFGATLSHLGISDETRVIAYDDAGGALAARLWWLLRWAGHQHVRLLDGGFSGWLRRNLPVEGGDVRHAATRFRVRVRPELVLDTAEILAAGATRTALQIVDARDGARYRGESEPIDTVAGHIPGTLNLPFTASLDADGCWKSQAELETLWRRALGRGFGHPWAVMCGSGVTACHLAVSGLRAGLPEPRLYVGSWSEWIRDPERPVA